ncbi:MAG: hypothetical protein K0R66_1385 [Gammaproteobacteria bacterium]|jgi:hypothetical protein|nr:hypothetical protein [Gammaproteobacteria bacterium]
MSKPYENFDKSHYHWRSDINYREHPELYKIGKGEQGVLICEPYKAEILPLWRFKTPDIAKESAEAIYQKFLDYLSQNDFVGADMARKFLQMGFTRSRRYANYKGGRKYQKNSDLQLTKGTGDPQKSISASIFYEYWQLAKSHVDYQKLKQEWIEKYQ